MFETGRSGLLAKVVASVIFGTMNFLLIKLAQKLGSPLVGVSLQSSLSPIATFFAGTLIFGTVLILFYPSGLNQAAKAKVTSKGAKLLGRLITLEKPRDVLSLSAQDHYVQIVTDVGEEKILMRFSDAILDCEDIEGVRIHRSHWVNLAHVRNAHRLAKDGFVLLDNQQRLPISKARMSRVIDAMRAYQEAGN